MSAAWADVLIALALLLTLNVVAVMRRRIGAVVLKDDYRMIFRYQLLLCGVLLLTAVDLGFDIFARLHWVGRIVRIGLIAVSVVILLLCGRVIAGCRIDTSGPADYAIVLGMALENGQPSRELHSRMDAAARYLEKYPEARLILTGGNADASGRTEAEVMREMLIARGVDPDRLISEDKARTTKENFINVAQMIDPAAPVVLITSDYHMDRSVRTAKQAGFADVRRLPAPSGLTDFGANMLWEVVLNLGELKL